MDNLEQVTRQAARVFRTKKISSFFVNGAPGSGRSFVLNYLAQALPADIPKLTVLGPYALDHTVENSLALKIVSELASLGFCDASIVDQCPSGYASAWRYLAPHLHVSRGQSFVVILDVSALQSDIDQMAALFSSIRSLETTPIDQGFGLYHLAGGYWDPTLLRHHYEAIGLSFPYTIADNYYVWEGIDNTSYLQILSDSERDRTFKELMIEITGGHLGAMVEIHQAVPEASLTLHSIIQTTDHIAQQGRSSERLLSVWCDSLHHSREALKHLLANRYLALKGTSEEYGLFRVAGIAKPKHIGTQHYLALKSWFVERILLHHSHALGIYDDWLINGLLEESQLDLVAFNQRAFELLHAIEITARQFVSVYLYRTGSNGSHFLQGRVEAVNKRNGMVEDLYTRAQDWRNRSSTNQMYIGYNPLVSYCSTTELAALISDISREHGRADWRRVSELIKNMVPIRDAIMHNQLIDERALDLLLSLQDEVCELLSKAND